MSTPPQPPGARSAGPPSDDRTRDLRRPSLPNRPPAAVRRGAGESGAAPPAPARPDAALPTAETVRLQQPSPEALPSSPDTIAGQPTDELSSPPHERQRTLTFGGPPAVPAPSHPCPGSGAPSYGSPAYGVDGTPPAGRRWPWVVLVVLPILVIAAAGVLLFLLLGGA